MNDGPLGRVLLVDADASERQRLGDALEKARFEVLACPGPTDPDDGCLGTRTGTCPLLADVDVVVLDVQLEADEVGFHSTSEELLNLYLGSGRPVVALGLLGSRLSEGRLLRLRRSPDAGELVRGVAGSSASAARTLNDAGHESRVKTEALG
jgi:hypothetical protein